MWPMNYVTDRAFPIGLRHAEGCICLATVHVPTCKQEARQIANRTAKGNRNAPALHCTVTAFCQTEKPCVSRSLAKTSVVGYNTQAVQGDKLYCIGLQFSDVGVAGDLASIAKLSTSGITPGAYDTMYTDAPCIMIYNGVGYDYYYYISDAYDANGDETTAWADGGGDETADQKTIGTGCWLRIPAGKATNGSVTSAGEVNDAESSTIDIANGLTLACSPYPVALNMAKVTTSGLTAGTDDTMYTDAPCIMVYHGVGYEYYYYISDAYDVGGNEVTAWADGGGDAVTGEIANVGEAFWVRSGSAGTLTIAK